eukprot:4000046-Pyramimonas_sp.AAC.1
MDSFPPPAPAPLTRQGLDSAQWTMASPSATCSSEPSLVEARGCLRNHRWIRLASSPSTVAGGNTR